MDGIDLLHSWGGGQGGPGARSAEGQKGARSAEEYGGRAPGQNIYGWFWIASCLEIDFLRLFGVLGMLFQRSICLRTSISKTSLLGNLRWDVLGDVRQRYPNWSSTSFQMRLLMPSYFKLIFTMDFSN